MRTILKQVEPDGFIRWKSANQEKIDRLITEGKTGDKIWELLLSSLSQEIVPNDYAKSELRDALVKEQFFICCYCNDVIKGKPLDTKIEHFLPKETYKQTIFDYQNLLAACNGGERESERPLHCDSFKLSKDPSKFQLVSPFDNDASKHFYFNVDREIKSNTEQGKNTIIFLNIDSKRLNFRRKVAIKKYLEILDEGEDIDSLIEEVSEIVDGKLQAFCMAILSVLKSYK